MAGIKRKRISHRRVHFWLVIIILIFSGSVIYTTFRLTNSFKRITAAAKQHSELQTAANELMNASDYLTEQVQRFTLNGDRRFLDQYFTEAFESKRREEAIKKMDMGSGTEEALRQLQKAMDNSIELMDREYYAMRLVIEAKGYTEYPDILKSIDIRPEDIALSPDDMIRRANEIVLNDEYYEKKDRIRKGMQESLNEVEKLAQSVDDTEQTLLKRELMIARTAILMQAALVFFMIWLTTRYSITPVLRAIEQVKADLPIDEYGSDEFIYLAKAYNKIYQKNKSSLEHLSFKASHDELTGAYNRAGYEHLLTSIDLDTTYMMLFDVDDFKSFNDIYGHETGDKVLIKVVKVLRKVFRNEDCICRIGGDEFVVFLVHSGSINRSLIESKISQIHAELKDTKDGVPPISVSIGIMNGKAAADTSNLFEKADEAMYESKQNGKGTYTFSASQGNEEMPEE